MRLALSGSMIFFIAATASAADLQTGLQAYHRGDYAAAIAECRPLAEQGNAAAQLVIGVMYLEGDGLPKDDAKAAQWMGNAAAQWLADAQYNMALLCAKVEGVPQDFKQAAGWDLKAATAGNADAQYNLALMYERGQGVQQDYAQAIAWYREAATRNDAGVLSHLAMLYANGSGIAQDRVAAYALVTLAVAADNTDAVVAADRDAVVKPMTPPQIEAGEALLRKMQDIGVVEALDASRPDH